MALDPFYPHHHHLSDRQLLTLVNYKLDLLLNQGRLIMTDLTQLTAEVTNNTSVEQSAITLLGNLKTALDNAGTDPVQLKALSDQLGSNDAALAAAITANTPASKPPPAAPTFAPTSISGPVGTPISGQFTASDGSTHTYASDNAVADVTVSASGAFSCPAATAESGTLTVTPTDASGVAGTPFSVSVSIT